jgi:hypothetical protein
MKVTNQNVLPIPGSLLTALRDIERKPAESMEDMRRITQAQARALRAALLGPAHQLPGYLSRMLPAIRVGQVTDLPVSGISYWTEHHWHIHVRSNDTPEERAFTVLHQLKRIIDNPLRRQTKRFTEADWDSLTDYFARQVLLSNSAEATS